MMFSIGGSEKVVMLELLVLSLLACAGMGSEIWRDKGSALSRENYKGNVESSQPLDRPKPSAL